METLARQTIKEVFTDDANEMRLNLKEIEFLLGKDSKSYKRVERRLSKLTKQASKMGMEI